MANVTSGPSWSPENLLSNILGSLFSKGPTLPGAHPAPSWSPEVAVPNAIGNFLSPLAIPPAISPTGRPTPPAAAKLATGDTPVQGASNDAAAQTLRQRDTAPPAEPDMTPEELGQMLEPAGGAPQPQQVPHGAVSQSQALKSAMLQAGLALMTPQWGGPLSNIGNALGQGAEAYTRAKQQPIEQEREQLTNEQIRAKTAEENAQADYYEAGGKAVKSATKDRSTEGERLMTNLGLGAKGSAYFKTRMKEFGDITNPDSEIPSRERFDKILKEAQGLDNIATAQPSGTYGGQPNETATATAVPKYNAGDTVEGKSGTFKFKGGDQNDSKNWVKIK